MEGDCGSSSSSHCEYNVYLSLAYPINSYSKFVTVGLYKELNYEPGVLFTNGKKKRILLDFSEWNYLMIFREQLLSSMLLYEEGENRENKKSVMISHHFGKTFVRINGSKNETFVFTEPEWMRFGYLLTVLKKYLIRLFYDQDHFKSYINQVVAKGCYVPPSFFFPSFFRLECSRHDQQLTFDRLYDELVLEGKVEGEFQKINVLDADMCHSEK